MTSSKHQPIRRFAVLLTFLFGLPQAWAHGQELVEVTGTLVIQVVDDFAKGSSDLVYVVWDEATDRLIALDLSGRQVAGLSSGDRVRLQGRISHDRLRVGALELLQVKMAAPSAAAMTGSRRVVTILVNMADATLGTNCSKTNVANELYNAHESMAQFFQEASFGQLTFPADTNNDGQTDIFGPFTIPDRTTDGQGLPPRWTWIQHAEAAATAAGVNFNLYQHRVFVFPNADQCTTAWGWLGCPNDTCYVAACSWPSSISECVSATTFAHEIGHNLGMGHAAVDANNDDIIDSGEEYGDGSDVMGDGHCSWRGPLFHPNGPHKYQIGWFDGYPASVVVVDLNEPGRPTLFTLSTIEPVPPGVAHPQVLHLAGNYFLSTRLATGYDAGIDVDCPFNVFRQFTSVTSVHRLWSDGHTLLIATLHDGERLETPEFRVRQVSHTVNSVTLEIPEGPFLSFQVTSITPNGGSTLGNTPVTVRGAEFQLGAQVEIGGVAATGENVVNSTTITALTSAHAAGVVDVEVINPDATTTTKPNAFFYYEPATLSFYTLTPCRVFDTRNPTGPYGGPALVGGATRVFTIAGQCGVPFTAKAISANVTVTGPAQIGYLELFPTNAFAFGTSTINFSAGQTRANNAIMMLATDGTCRLSVFNGSGSSTHLILDVNGWFE